MRKLIVAGLMVFAAVFFTGAWIAGAEEEAARVPFPFIVGNVQLPAGRYVVEADNMDPNLIQVTSVDGRHSAFAVVNINDMPLSWGHCDFQFVRFGGKYYLSKIDTGDNGIEDVTLPEWLEHAVHATREAR